MKYQEALIAWTPHTDKITVGHWPDTTGWKNEYASTAGACYPHIREINNAFKRDLMLFLDFHAIVVRDKVPVEAAHTAFLEIDEYRKRIAQEVRGAKW